MIIAWWMCSKVSKTSLWPLINPINQLFKQLFGPWEKWWKSLRIWWIIFGGTKRRTLFAFHWEVVQASVTGQMQLHTAVTSYIKNTTHLIITRAAYRAWKHQQHPLFYSYFRPEIRGIFFKTHWGKNQLFFQKLPSILCLKNVTFVKNENLKMWILWKMGI